MKIVIPMAGRGSRMAGYQGNLPKPLVKVAGRPMLAWAIESLSGLDFSQMVFVALKEHDTLFDICDQIQHYAGIGVRVLLLDDVTEGQLCTVLAARESISIDEDVLIASADTYVVSNLAEAIRCAASDCQGIISVADMPGDRWSFARVDASGRVVEVTEKVRISNHASTGLYYFSSGRDLVETADNMIRRQEKTRGEYYIMPVYQKYIERGWRVEIAPAQQMWDMGTPEALESFEVFLKTRNSTKSLRVTKEKPCHP